MDLVAGIVDDARTLLAAHLEALRGDLGGHLADLGVALRQTLIAISAIIVTTLLLGLALAATLVTLGLPWWAALWLVTAVAATTGLALTLSARRSPRPALVPRAEPSLSPRRSPP